MKYLVVTQLGMVRRIFPSCGVARRSITRSYRGCTIVAVEDGSLYTPGDHVTMEDFSRGHIRSTQERKGELVKEAR